MAKSGTITTYMTLGGGGAYWHSLTPPSSGVAPMTANFNWEVISTDVINGTTTVKYSYVFTVPAGNTGFEYVKLRRALMYETNIPGRSSWDGETMFDVFTNVNIYVGESYTAQEGTWTFLHEDDGTRTVGFMFNFACSGLWKTVNGVETQVQSTAGSSAGNKETTLTLDPVPIHAILTSVPTTFTDEQSVTIGYTVPSKITEVYAYISLSGTTKDIPARAISATGSSYTFNFTNSEKRTLWGILDRGLETKQVWFCIESINDAGVHYLERLSSNLQIVNFMPTLNPEIWDTNMDVINRLTGNKYILVRHVSKAAYTTGGEAKKHATIDSQTAKNGDLTKYGASGTFDNVTDNLFTFTITDSFGRTTQAETEISRSSGYFVDYVKLSCSVAVSDMTADGDVQVTITGKCFTGDFGRKTNRLRVFYDITKNNDEDFTHVDLGYADLASNYGNSFTVNGTDYTYKLNITGLEYLNVYDFRVWVADEVATEGVSAFTVLASTPIFDWGRADFNFNVPVNVEGDLTVSGNITAGGKTVPTIQAQGTSGIWTYRTWSDGTAECWGKKDVSVTFPSSANWGGLYTTGAISGSNISFPYGLFAETPTVNASLLVRSAGGILMAPGGAGSNIANKDQTGVYEIARGASVSGTQYYTINYQVIGKWK